MSDEFTSRDYMDYCEPNEVSCVTCGILMVHMSRNAKYACGNCGIVIMRDGTKSKYLLPRIK